ncbi:MAG: Ig-like domain-containing protein [Candidatus Sulfotelmatobacter sp.]|jgi:hypothetical protein
MDSILFIMGVVPPFVVQTSPVQGAQNVPLNAILTVEMSQPVDPGTVNGNTVALVNSNNGQTVAGSYSVSADGLTILIMPSAPLSPSVSYYVSFAIAGSIADLAGNTLQTSYPCSFTTGTTSSTAVPQVLGMRIIDEDRPDESAEVP